MFQTSFQLKGYVPKLKKDFILYRSFKDFNHEFCLNDLQSVNFENQIADDDVNRLGLFVRITSISVGFAFFV
jgi:hypothetical protein